MDYLAPLLSRVRAEATADGMRVLSGRAISEGVEARVISVAPDAANPDEVFLALARLAEAQLIVIDEQRLDGADIEFASGDKEVLARHLGQVHTASLTAFPRGLAPLVTLLVSADWAEELFGKDEVVASDESVAQLSPAQEAAANQLANDPRFAEMPYHLRVPLLKRLAPEALDPQRIVERAAEIFELDIRPDREAKLRAQALDLLESGMTQGKVVAKLGLKNTYALRKLIGEA